MWRRILNAGMPFGLTLLLSACSGTAPGDDSGSSLAPSIGISTAPSSSAYSAIAFAIQPIFNFLLGTNLDAGATGPLTLSAFSDAACSAHATGTLSVAQNPVTVSLGTAAFSGVAYTLPGHAEEKIYLGVTSAAGLAKCSSAITIQQIFSAGSGYVSFGATGAAGGTGAGEYDWGAFVKMDSQRRLVVGGGSQNAAGGWEFAIWRYFPDGTLDTSFGGTGIVTTGATGAAGATGANEDDEPNALQIDGQGRIVIAGWSKNVAGGYEVVVRRYLPNGTLDASFGGTGVVTSGAPGIAGATGASQFDAAYALEIDALGRLIIAGSSHAASGAGKAMLMRLNADGTLDTTFGGTGSVISAASAAGSTSEHDNGQALVVDHQGRYIIGGVSDKTGGGWELALRRYNNDGTIDTSFGGTGVVTSGATGAGGATGATQREGPWAMAVDSQDRVLAAGYTTNASLGYESVVWRYNDNGTPDTSFGGAGYITSGVIGLAGATGGSEYDAAGNLAIDSQNRIVVTGGSTNAVGGVEAVVWRFNTDGTPDTSFAGTGYVKSGATGYAGATGANESDWNTGLFIDDQGRLVIAGSSKNPGGGTEGYLRRYLPDGQLDK